MKREYYPDCLLLSVRRKGGVFSEYVVQSCLKYRELCERNGWSIDNVEVHVHPNHGHGYTFEDRATIYVFAHLPIVPDEDMAPEDPIQFRRLFATEARVEA